MVLNDERRHLDDGFYDDLSNRSLRLVLQFEYKIKTPTYSQRPV